MGFPFFAGRRNALVNGEYVHLPSLKKFGPSNYSMWWYVPECSHLIGLNGQVHTGSLSTSAAQKDLNQSVCLSVCPTIFRVSHFILPLFHWGLCVLMTHQFNERIHPKTSFTRLLFLELSFFDTNHHGLVRFRYFQYSHSGVTHQNISLYLKLQVIND